MVKGGLRLKREVIAKSPTKPVGDLIVANLWVDASVHHLDGEYSYLIPGNLSQSISVGSFVSVPFNGREITGVVVSINEIGSSIGLKSISKALGVMPLLSEEMIELIRLASKRYASHPFDLIRSAIPDRLLSVEREFVDRVLPESVVMSSVSRFYLQLPPAVSRSMLMAEKVQRLSNAGAVLVVVPDLRELEMLTRALENSETVFTTLGSHLPKSQNYRNFLKARYGDVSVVIGTRSAIFAPLLNVRSIMVYNEGSEHLYERRTPGWNVRDIALLRSQNEILDLYFVGYSPSVEIARLIDEKWISYKRSRGKTAVQTIASINGELLPSHAMTPIKKSLSNGPVLFLVPLKGYAQAIRCQKCRTISRCSCGGAHEKLSASAPITCSHCQSKSEQWRCIWCNGETPSLVSRGIERHHLEIGKLFPGVKIQSSSSDHPISDDVESGVVIATPGMAPISKSGYSALVILEGNRFLNQPDMRSSERMREMYFSHSALARSGAPILLIQDEGDQIATALATWNPSIALHRDLEERKSLSLPPYVRSAHLTLETAEISRFKSALIVAQSDGRLPLSTRILGPIPAGDKASLILTVDISEGEALLSTLHEFMRRRSAAKKTLPALRIDPYSLSR